MGTREQLVYDNAGPQRCDSIDTGDVVATYERSANPRSDSKSSVYANLTTHGVRHHRIDGDTQLEVVVCENGIWITPTDE